MSKLLKCCTSACTFFSFLLCFSFPENSSIEWSISNLSLVKKLQKLLCFWDQSLVFQKAFILLLFISTMLIVQPKNAKTDSRLVGFNLWNQEQIPRWPFKIRFLSNKFVSAVSASKNSSPNKCKKYLCAGLRIFTNTFYLPWSIDWRKLYWW